jgi:NTP pyrophosphatase (non-canonical NTP hydrolase)
MTSLLIDTETNQLELLNKFQQVVKETHIHKFNQYDILYFSNGLGGECGEVQNEVKKLYRALIQGSESKNIQEINRRKQNIKSELGDVMWYLTAIANKLNYSLEDILLQSITKCQKHVQQSSYKSPDKIFSETSINDKELGKISPEEKSALRNLVKKEKDYWTNN